MSEQPMTKAGGRRLVWVLGSLGLLQAVLMISLTVLFTGYPAGFNSPYGLNLSAASYFQQVWAYPALRIVAPDFQRLAWLIILGLWLIYLCSLPLVRRLETGPWRRSTWWVLFGFFLLSTAIVVAFVPPVFSSDIYHYALYGRMTALHGLDPYAVTGGFTPGDPFWPLTAWREVTSRYGPAWTLISAGLTTLAGDSVLATLVLFKTLAGLCLVASGALVYLLARLLTGSAGLVPLLLFAWNPLVVVETAGNAHLDAAMLALALLGLWLGLRGRVLWGLLFLLLSLQVKLTTALLVPFYIVYFWRDQALAGRGGRFLLQALGVALASALLLYLPFATPGSSVGRVLLSGQATLNVMPNPVWLSARQGLYVIAESLGWDAVLATPGAVLVALLTLVFGMLLLALLVDMGRRSYDWPRIVWLWGVLTLAYVFLVHGGSFPWYLIVPLAAASIVWPAGRTHFFWASCVFLSLFLMLLYATTIPAPTRAIP